MGDAGTGNMVKRGTSDRVCSGNTYYRIGWPGQGPGKIARALTWNRVLNIKEIQQVASTLTGTPKAANFDLNAAAQLSDIPKDSKKMMTFKKMAVKTDDSLPYWDLNNNYLERSGGGTLKDGQFYTHAYVPKWRVSDKGWRTLLRHNNDHCIIVRDGGKDLGMYSNRKSGFRDSGYNIVPQNNFWEIVLVTGKGSSANTHAGVSTLYTMDGDTGKMMRRGTVDRVCSGNTYYRIGWDGQGPGKIARALSWGRVLNTDEIQQLAKTLTGEVCQEPCKRTAFRAAVMNSAIFDLNAAAQTSSTPKDSK